MAITTSYTYNKDLLRPIVPDNPDGIFKPDPRDFRFVCLMSSILVVRGGPIETLLVAPIVEPGANSLEGVCKPRRTYTKIYNFMITIQCEIVD